MTPIPTPTQTVRPTAIPTGIPTAIGRLHQREVRAASGAMVAVAAVWPLLPVHPPIACPLRAATGVPCPFCGMTRAVVAAVHGHLGASLAFNPGGIVVLLLAVVAIVRPAWLRRLRAPGWALVAIVGALWVWNAGFNPTFHQLLLR
ncbi:MAG TPA: DUF2752 domain-containing protein [Acidimicrobiia bacterium]|nr:DUF2752 domain-containing protein [Acidimicrobiia bacterium]